MRKICEGPGCWAEFDAKRKTAKYHHVNCRVAAGRNPDQAGPKDPAKRPGGPLPADTAAGPIELATITELGARAATAQGQVAVMLARRLDHAAGDMLAAVAAASERWSAAMERALAREGEDDPVAARVTRIGTKLRAVQGAGRSQR
jgi:hypothetical protein